MGKKLGVLLGMLMVGLVLTSNVASAKTLRLITWGGYAPEAVIKLFKAKTGIDVEVTVSNNEDIISKLRATGGAGFDLAQPSQDRITGPQFEYGIYKPIDYSQIDSSLFIGPLFEAAKKNTTLDGKAYGVAHIWGTYGLVADKSKAPDIHDFTDLCNPKYAGKVSMRLKRPVLIGMAYAMGMDPFAAYGDKAKYKEIIEKSGAKLAECKSNVKAYWSGSDDLLNLIRSGEVVASGAWDSTGFKLNSENPNMNFVVPKSGALGWIDTFALPAKTKAEAEAYKWINFVMQPKIAAMITDASGSFAASKGSKELVSKSLSKAFSEAFTEKDIANINWFPTIPPGLEDMEGKILDRIAAQ